MTYSSHVIEQPKRSRKSREFAPHLGSLSDEDEEANEDEQALRLFKRHDCAHVIRREAAPGNDRAVAVRR